MRRLPSVRLRLENNSLDQKSLNKNQYLWKYQGQRACGSGSDVHLADSGLCSSKHHVSHVSAGLKFFVIIPKEGLVGTSPVKPPS